MRKKELLVFFLLIFQVIFPSCGSENNSEEKHPAPTDQSTPEGLAELVYDEIRSGEFGPASDLYFGDTRVLEYYNEDSLYRGTIGLIKDLEGDSERKHNDLKNNTIAFAEILEIRSGNLPYTLPGKTLPFREVEVYSVNGPPPLFHIGRMVKYEDDLWYVLILDTTTVSFFTN